MKLQTVASASLIPAYLEAGWTQDAEFVYKVLDSNIEALPSDYLISEKPLTLLSGTINRPLSRYKSCGLVHCVSLHDLYAGVLQESKLTISTLCIRERLSLYEIQPVQDITRSLGDHTCLLRMFAVFNSEKSKDSYIRSLCQLYNSPEGMLVNFDKMSTAVDFWWDVGNHVLLTFDRNFASRFAEIVQL